MKRIAAIVLFIVSLCLQIQAARALETPSLVKDINTTEVTDDLWGLVSRFPLMPTTMGGAYYFVAGEPEHGQELWKSDGTAAGTAMIKDINPGFASSEIQILTATEDTLYFTADDGTSNRAVWKTDGTSAGTLKIDGIPVGTGVTRAGDLFYLIVYDSQSNSFVLWKTDWTAAGTVPLKSTDPSELTAIGNTLYFRAADSAHGSELWKTDGTAAGTVMVKDINPGPAGSSLIWLTNVAGSLYFWTYDATGRELWKSDGTEAGTVLVKDMTPQTNAAGPTHLGAAGNTLYFWTYDTSTTQRVLWKSDGTSTGTVALKDLNAGSDVANAPAPTLLGAVGNTLYFTATNAATGCELWKSDGTATGTAVVKDINPGSSSSSPAAPIVVGGSLYFQATDATHGAEIWKSNGTAAGTVLVKDLYPGSNSSNPRNPVLVGNSLFWQATDAKNAVGIWKSDGTAAGTVLVRGISRASWGSHPQSLTPMAGTLYFTAYDDVYSGLWKSDGTAAGTTLVKHLDFGTYYSGLGYAEHMTAVGNALYFSASDDTHEEELWKSDGTASGTMLVKDIKTSTTNYNTSSYPSNLTALGNTLYFTADDATHGDELWKSDGSEAGTTLVKDISPGSGGSYPRFLTPVGNILYFAADDAAHGYELWKSDGTAAGTVMVKDINPASGTFGPGPSGPYSLTAVGNTLYFTADDGSTGWELWKSDGTASGTVQVKDINPGSAGSDPWYLTVMGNTLYFSATDPANGNEFWRSDGTAAGTELIKDIHPGPFGSDPLRLTTIGNNLFFRASDGVSLSLWISDGTGAGTTPIRSFDPGSDGNGIYETIAMGSTLYFVAHSSSGAELWKSDGTASGTVRIKTVLPIYMYPSARVGVGPFYLTNLNGNLYFQGADVFSGAELWRLDPDPPEPEIRITGLSPSIYKIGTLKAGQPVYTDRTYVFKETIPSKLRSHTYIQTAQAQRDTSGTAVVSFTIDRAANVYVALNSRITTPPAWLRSWKKLPDILKTSDGVPNRTVYTKTFAPGKVKLGGNWESPMPKGNSMYTVVIAPLIAGVEDWTNYANLAAMYR